MLTSPPTALERTRNLLHRGLDDRLHLGAQLYVSTPAGVVADLAIGQSHPKRAMRSDDLV
jgi:hypothetical protein